MLHSPPGLDRSIQWDPFGINAGGARLATLAHDENAQVDSAAHLRAVWRRSSPEVLEPLGRQLGMAHRVLDIAVAEVGLQCARIVPLVREREAAGVP